MMKLTIILATILTVSCGTEITPEEVSELVEQINTMSLDDAAGEFKGACFDTGTECSVNVEIQDKKMIVTGPYEFELDFDREVIAENYGSDLTSKSVMIDGDDYHVEISFADIAGEPATMTILDETSTVFQGGLQL
jgi:hypothetical protein